MHTRYLPLSRITQMRFIVCSTQTLPVPATAQAWSRFGPPTLKARDVRAGAVTASVEPDKQEAA